VKLVAHIAAVVALAGCNSCQPPALPTATDQSVYNALVDAGCLGPSDGGVAAVAAEHASPNPAWLNCMYNGGTVGGCQVPCK
jgi:hypothetical protein